MLCCNQDIDREFCKERHAKDRTNYFVIWWVSLLLCFSVEKESFIHADIDDMFRFMELCLSAPWYPHSLGCKIKEFKSISRFHLTSYRESYLSRTKTLRRGPLSQWTKECVSWSKPQLYPVQTPSNHRCPFSLPLFWTSSRWFATLPLSLLNFPTCHTRPISWTGGVASLTLVNHRSGCPANVTDKCIFLMNLVRYSASQPHRCLTLKKAYAGLALALARFPLRCWFVPYQ